MSKTQTLIHQSIEIAAREQPEHTAFRCREQSLSYRELYQKACQLATTLRAQGLEPMDRIGIHMNKAIEMPIAIYGILLAGGVYVPIDTTAPLDRIEFIARDCGIRFLITNPDKKKKISKISSDSKTPLKTIIGLESENASPYEYISWKSIFETKASRPLEWTREDDLAYIMYTSGSTGEPKGLMHTHRSGLAYARYSAELYDVTPSDILGNHAPIHFDISTFEYITGPFAGATSVLIPEEEIMFPVSLSRFIEKEKLTFWYSVPLALSQLVTRGDMDGLDLSSLRWILFGGEPFPPKYLRELKQRMPDARFCNVYGPAEVNQCTFYNIPKNDQIADEPIPIGHVWSGAHFLILDSDDQPISGEGRGELAISSSTMMRGYWARPDLDEKAFYTTTPVSGFQRRYYRTGDLISQDSDGLLHFLGRKDRQIKLRGYRIELDEIEAAFTKQEEVEETAAVLVEDEQGENFILAIVSTVEGHVFDPASSLKFAKATLPSYASPRQVITTKDFPRTGSGKIDRSKLTALHNERIS